MPSLPLLQHPSPAAAQAGPLPTVGKLQADFSSWVAATSDPSDLKLGEAGFVYADLFAPERLADLAQRFDAFFQATDPAGHARFAAYRACGGEGMTPEQTSEALLAGAPHVSSFVARLFGVQHPVETKIEAAKRQSSLWHFKKEFAKKRLFKTSAGTAWKGTVTEAGVLAKGALSAIGVPSGTLDTGSDDEELEVARGVIALQAVDDIARKAAKAGGAEWSDELRARAATVRSAVGGRSGEDDGGLVARVLDGVEAWLNARRKDHHDPAHRWPSLKAPAPIDHDHLVQIRRPDPALPELFVGPADERRHRDGFALTDRRMAEREVEAEVDYCLYCHDRDKDSCSKGLRDPKTKALKKNPLGVELAGCPLGERISEMHLMRQGGDSIAALALVCIDNPMLPGTGHRICNDCMKACVFQRQEPVNIPQIETAVLTSVLGLPWGLEIYGLLTRWNPLNIDRPYSLPYNGKNVLVVGLGPAGYTLAHHLSSEGFAVAGIDGLKLEQLPRELLGDDEHPPRPVRDFAKLYLELDERILLGFGGVSEYGITIRWDKNFLTVLYLTLARQRLLRMYGGVRFGGTVDLEDAFNHLGFDHIAIAAGAGRPTIIPLKNNIARGIRKASDFLMGLQLTGAYKRSSLANMQIRLPAVVIGGGLTAIDTATELLAYYIVQVEKTADRLDALIADRGEVSAMAMFTDPDEREFMAEQRAHATLVRAEREQAMREGRAPNFQRLLDSWGGVSLVYRKRVLDSPAYRLNHEEVAKSLEEGVRYIENFAPVEAVLDDRGAVKAMIFERQKLEADASHPADRPGVVRDPSHPADRPGAVRDKWIATGERIEVPARSVCVAAGTSPNVTYERERPGAFAFDRFQQYYAPHTAAVAADGTLTVTPAAPKDGFFTSYTDGKRAVSFYGDNHPHYAGSVVKAMASAKDAYPAVKALFQRDIDRLGTEPQIARDARRKALFAHLDDELCAVVQEVKRLTRTIVEVTVRAPAAARRFEPGQFYRLQNFEARSTVVSGTRLAMEGVALTGAWVDKERGLLSMIALEMGVSTKLLASLKPGEPVVLMGPTGTATEIPTNETVLLAGGGLGNAVLFSIAKALKGSGANVLYFAGYKDGADLFKQDEIEVATDQIIWCTDQGITIEPRRPTDRHFRGNIVQAMEAYGEGRLGGELFKLSDVARIIAIGSDRMMNGVREARHGILAPMLDPKHVGIASINSPMQCMLKEVCAQCLQKHVDPATGKETIIFSCFNQDQLLDHVDFKNLSARLRANTAQEKLSSAWLDRLVGERPGFRRV